MFQAPSTQRRHINSGPYPYRHVPSASGPGIAGQRSSVSEQVVDFSREDLTVKKTLLIIVAAILLAGSAQAAPITYVAVLGNFENPPTGSTGSGFATVTIDTTANTLFVEASFQDLIGTTTAAHIHCCIAAPGNVGVATQTPSFAGFPLGVTSGIFSNTFDTTLASTYRAGFITANGGTTAGAEEALAVGLAGGQAYFNIHTTAYGGGEIRGFLTPVPEPMTVSLLGLGLGALALARRQRRA